MLNSNANLAEPMSQTSERSEKVDELLKKIKRVESCRSKRPLDMDDLRAEIEEMEPQNIDSTKS